MPAFYEAISWKYYPMNNMIAISMGTADILALLYFHSVKHSNVLEISW